MPQRYPHSFGTSSRTGVSLAAAQLQRESHARARAVDADSHESVLEHAALEGATLYEANLRGARLQRARLGAACLQYADLTGAHLAGADLSRANLSGARLTGADLAGASLRGARLFLAQVGDDTLRFSDLTDADLTCLCLTPTELIRPPCVPALAQRALVLLRTPRAPRPVDLVECVLLLAGSAAAPLVSRVGERVAAAMICHANIGRVPDFYTTTEETIRGLQRHSSATG